MIGLLKAFGKGILYVIGAPFFVVALVLFGAIGLLAFIFQIFKSIIFFFTGQKFFPELPEDKELRLKREAAAAREEPVQEERDDNIISPIFEEEIPMPEIKEAPIFIEKEEPKPEPTIEDTVFEDASSIEDFINDEEEDNPEETVEEEEEETVEEEKHTVLETSEEPEEEEEEFEELETYVPRSSTYSDANDDEDNNTDSGVDIKYDL